MQDNKRTRKKFNLIGESRSEFHIPIKTIDNICLVCFFSDSYTHKLYIPIKIIADMIAFIIAFFERRISVYPSVVVTDLILVLHGEEKKKKEKKKKLIKL